MKCGAEQVKVDLLIDIFVYRSLKVCEIKRSQSLNQTSALRVSAQVHYSKVLGVAEEFNSSGSSQVFSFFRKSSKKFNRPNFRQSPYLLEGYLACRFVIKTFTIWNSSFRFNF